MHLLYSAGSPFARLVRIALLETGLDALVTKDQLRRTQLYLPESDVLVLNPVGACRHWNWRRRAKAKSRNRSLIARLRSGMANWCSRGAQMEPALIWASGAA
jgi:hypothetical protein